MPPRGSGSKSKIGRTPSRKVKSCAYRKSKLLPNVYILKELVEMAKSQGLTATQIRQMKKRDLCDYLGVEWVESSSKKPSKTSSKKKPSRKDSTEIRLKNRPCNVSRSKAHPNAYTKEELVEYAVSKGWVKSQAQKKSKEGLCRDLKEGKMPEEKRTSKKKSAKTPAKKAPSKKSSQSFSRKEPPLPPVRPPKNPNPSKPLEPPPRKASEPTIIRKGDCISRSGLPLKEHQRLVVEYLKTHRGVIAAYGVGSGKTLLAVTASQCLLDDHPDWKVIVVTPTSLQENFKKEMRAYGANPDDPRYIFMTLKTFALRYTDGSLRCNDKTFLIIDEAHNLRTDIVKALKAQSKRKLTCTAKSCDPQAYVGIECAKRAGKVLLLTATPVYNNPRDVANLVAMVKGQEPLTKHFFDKMMADDDAFRKYFSCVFAFYEVDKSSDDYPRKEEHSIDIIMSPEYLRKYSAIEHQNAHLARDTDPWKFLNGVRQATNALEPCQKCQWAVNKILEGQKTVLYSSFKTFGIQKIQSMLKGSGVKYLEIQGSTPKARRSEIVREYNSPGGPRVLFITKAGGEGLDLKGVRNVILLEAGWNRPGEEQVIGRAVRYRSHHHLPLHERKVDVYHLTIVKPKGAISKPPKKSKKGTSSKSEKTRKTKPYKEISQRGSADEMLRDLIREKDEKGQLFLERLKRISIAEGRCGVPEPPPKEYISKIYVSRDLPFSGSIEPHLLSFDLDLFKIYKVTGLRYYSSDRPYIEVIGHERLNIPQTRMVAWHLMREFDEMWNKKYRIDDSISEKDCDTISCVKIVEKPDI